MDVIGYGVSSTLGAGLFVVTGKAAREFAGPVRTKDPGRCVCLGVAILRLHDALSEGKLATYVVVIAFQAVCISYVLAGLASLFSALCYAEFATK
eukprot:scaffold10782_cov35-Prasinocladus_malaysianus.AAC.1